ncbi:MAG: hypothetical protein IJX78_05920 [Bacilli bacterium]|nr:hypothetical protein [Bacilli bacterium]
MEFKEIFDNRFPRQLRIRYRSNENSKVINDNLVYLLKINRINSYDLGNKYVEKVKKEAKCIG